MTRRKIDLAAAVVVAVVVAVLLSLRSCSTGSTIAGRGSLLIIGDWRVTYGAPAVVTIARSHGGYTMTAKTPVRVTGASCDLPPGTVIATFAVDRHGTYAGHHGLWLTSNCSFAQQTTVTVTLHPGDRLSELIGNGERHDLERV